MADDNELNQRPLPQQKGTPFLQEPLVLDCRCRCSNSGTQRNVSYRRRLRMKDHGSRTGMTGSSTGAPPGRERGARYRRRLPVALAVFLLLACSTLSCAPKQAQVAPNTAQVIPIAQQLVQALGQEDFAGAESYFDDALKGSLPTSSLQFNWDMIEHVSGPFVSEAVVSTTYQPPYTLVYITCQMQVDKIDVKVTFDAQNRVSGLSLQPDV